jgi:hypothetical protein
MGIDELHMARRIGLYNSEAIYFVKNNLMLMTAGIQKKLETDYEKFNILLKSKYKNIDVGLILANPTNNDNHNLTKQDIDLIHDFLVEHLENLQNEETQ